MTTTCTAATAAEPAPQPNGHAPVWPLVIADVLAARGRSPRYALSLLIADMAARDALGRARYGTALQPYNGRDALADLYQELLDAAVYARQAMIDAGLTEDEHQAIDLEVYRPLLAISMGLRAVVAARGGFGRRPAPAAPAPSPDLPAANAGRSA